MIVREPTTADRDAFVALDRIPLMFNNDMTIVNWVDESFGSGNLNEGSVVKGRVIAIEAGQAIIDVGYKIEGRVDLKEFAAPGEQPNVNVGDEVEVFLRNVENARGEAVISREMAKRDKVDIRYYSIIYNVTDDVKNLMAGLLDPTSKALGVALVDHNADGWLDLFVANDTQPNRLYENHMKKKKSDEDGGGGG